VAPEADTNQLKVVFSFILNFFHLSSLTTVSPLQHYLDVLFWFHNQAKYRLDTSSFVNEDVDDIIPAQYLDENQTASSFLRNIRGWIAYLVSALLKVASSKDHQFLLLHLIRSPGIGEWGARFLQFEKLENWSEHHVNNFLVMLNILVWPFEWASSKEASGSQYGGFLLLLFSFFFSERLLLSRSMNFEWVVVEDEDPAARKGSSAWKPKIGEDDYIAVSSGFWAWNNWPPSFHLHPLISFVVVGATSIHRILSIYWNAHQIEREYTVSVNTVFPVISSPEHPGISVDEFLKVKLPLLFEKVHFPSRVIFNPLFDSLFSTFLPTFNII